LHMITLGCRLSRESKQRGLCRAEDPILRRHRAISSMFACRTTNKLTRRFNIFGISPQSMSTNSLWKGLVEDARDIIKTARLMVQEKNTDKIFQRRRKRIRTRCCQLIRARRGKMVKLQGALCFLILSPFFFPLYFCFFT